MIEQSLSTEQTVALALAGLIAVVLVIARMKNAMLLAGAALFAAALGVALTADIIVIRTWVLPMQSVRSTLYLATGGLLWVAALIHVRQMKFGSIAGPAVVALCIALYAAFVRIVSGYAQEGLQSVVFALATIPPITLMAGSVIKDWDDAFTPLRMIALVGLVWLLCVAVQFGIDWRKLVVQHGVGRFHGLLSNPQHAAVYVSVTAITCLFLAINDPRVALRAIWVCLAGAFGIFVLWTGSRTGAGMSAIGVAAVLYRRLGRAVIALPILGLVGVVAFDFLSSSQVKLDIEGYTARGNNRMFAWARLWDEFVRSPVFGLGGPREIDSENSYLYALACYGIGMGALVLLLLIVVAAHSYRLWMGKRWMPERARRTADLVMGYYAMYFAGAMFEGYIMSRVSAALVFLLTFSAIGGRLIALSHAERRAAAFEQPGGEGSEEGVGGESGADSLIDVEAASAYEARTAG